MPEFSKTQAEVRVAVAPRFLNEPFQCIFTHVSRMLLKYSEPLRGIPLSFTIEGVTPHGQIQDDGSVDLNTLVEFCVVRISLGDRVCAHEGLYLSVFPCLVDGGSNYSGELRVAEIEAPARIIGTSAAHGDR